MTETTITSEERAAVEAALLSPKLHLTDGIGSGDGGPLAGERCTISEIHFVLTGVLSDGPHPCISDVIRRWVIPIQDAMPDSIRNSHDWRAAAVGIAGSAATPAVEAARAGMVMEWMWGILGDPAVLAVADRHGFRSDWDRMMSKRTTTAAIETAMVASAAGSAAAYHAAAAVTSAGSVAAAYHAAVAVTSAGSVAAYYAAVAVTSAAVDAVTSAADAAASDDTALWGRVDPAGLLARLVTA